jgi:hypothetical protein
MPGDLARVAAFWAPPPAPFRSCSFPRSARRRSGVHSSCLTCAGGPALPDLPWASYSRTCSLATDSPGLYCSRLQCSLQSLSLARLSMLTSAPGQSHCQRHPHCLCARSRPRHLSSSAHLSTMIPTMPDHTSRARPSAVAGTLAPGRFHRARRGDGLADDERIPLWHGGLPPGLRSPPVHHHAQVHELP